MRWSTVLGGRGVNARVHPEAVPNIIVNGEPRSVPTGATLSTLLQVLELSREHVAVERNREIVPRARYEQTGLAEGDTLEIVTFVGGG